MRCATTACESARSRSRHSGPFPLDALRAAIGHAKRVVVLEKCLALGLGGILSDGVRKSLSGIQLKGYTVIAGLGGRSITRASLRKLFEAAVREELESGDVPRSQHLRRRARTRARTAAASQRPDGRVGAAATRHGGLGHRLRGRTMDAAPARQVLPDRYVHGRQPPARRGRAQRAGEHGAHQLAELGSSRLPGLRRGARCALCARCRDACDRQPADRGQRDRLPRSVLDAVSGTSWQIPWLHSLFGNAAAVASGVAAALKVQGKEHVRVIAQGGDGGTTDIGFGCLSGMFERNDDVLYICYDNEAYMNTGVQRSSATPLAARTATTPAVGRGAGQRSRPRQERAADRDGAHHPVRRDRERRQPARPRGRR